MSGPAEMPGETRRYALFQYTDGGWSRRDEGVALQGDRLIWSVEGGEREVLLGDIVKVNLMLAGQGGDDAVGICIVTSGSGTALNITSGGAWGGADPGKAQDYRAFVKDLHETVLKRGGKAPLYIVGISGGRAKLLKAALVVGGALFVVMPVILLFMTGELNALWVALSAAGFGYPLYLQMQKNEPRTYSPNYIPDELMP